MSLLQKSIIPLTLALSHQGRGISPLERGIGVCHPSLDGRGWGGCLFETFARPSKYIKKGGAGGTSF